MKLKVAYFFNLLLAGVMVGNEFGGWFVLHPALHTLPLKSHVEAEKAVTKGYGRVMPFMMLGAILSCVPVLSMLGDRKSASFRFTRAGMLSFMAMLGVTFLGNMPINRRVLEVSADAPPPDWLDLRRRWDRFHTARIFLDVAGLGLIILGLISRSKRDLGEQ